MSLVDCASALSLSTGPGWPFPLTCSASATWARVELAWTVLVVFGNPARVWCSAWVRVCRLSAGPARAVNTQPQVSSVSASALPNAVPTVRVRAGH